ncbi:hypothetical protein ACISU4_01315 [Streptomyces wuyuanensis]|uniref:hypothetical protein n=1 Tax=Streptomyces wuyuanensis TaxID=1196353 RepID=UPI00381C6860
MQEVRDALPPAPEGCTVAPAPRPAEEGVPPELLALVTHRCRRINAYLARAQQLQALHGDSMRQWQRLVLYARTDALAHNHLLVGTLQSPDTDRYITGEAVEHLDGLTGAVPEEAAEPVWTGLGRRIVRDAG